jgi:hypothetical protein
VGLSPNDTLLGVAESLSSGGLVEVSKNHFGPCIPLRIGLRLLSCGAVPLNKERFRGGDSMAPHLGPNLPEAKMPAPLRERPEPEEVTSSPLRPLPP